MHCTAAMWIPGGAGSWEMCSASACSSIEIALYTAELSRMSVGKKYPRAFTVRAVDASVMDVPAALVYGPGMARPALIAVTQLFLYSATWQRTPVRSEWPVGVTAPQFRFVFGVHVLSFSDGHLYRPNARKP